jgi:hypothetical protein
MSKDSVYFELVIGNLILNDDGLTGITKPAWNTSKVHRPDLWLFLSSNSGTPFFMMFDLDSLQQIRFTGVNYNVPFVNDCKILGMNDDGYDLVPAYGYNVDKAHPSIKILNDRIKLITKLINDSTNIIYDSLDNIDV